jgi:flagellum-specific peptidoglycan hydrolase FlgJ
MSKQTDFINKVKQGAIKGWLDYKILPSLTIAQMALESGWGEYHMGDANNYFGIKADSSWKGSFVSVPTKEWSHERGYYVITARFRRYDSVEESMLDRCKFLTGFKRYASLIGEKDFHKATQKIHEAGYATDVHYHALLDNIIISNKLHEIDKEAFALELPIHEGDDEIMKLTGSLKESFIAELTELCDEKKNGKNALNKVWLEKALKDELSCSEAIGLLFVVKRRGL